MKPSSQELLEQAFRKSELVKPWVTSPYQGKPRASVKALIVTPSNRQCKTGAIYGRVFEDELLSEEYAVSYFDFKFTIEYKKCR